MIDNMIDIIIAILLLIISYLIGAIPFGLLIGKIKGKDLRKQGSGNTGSTNATRVLGFGLGLFTAFCDIFKGAIIIFLIYILEANGIWKNPLIINGESLYALYGLAAVIGHCYPIYLKFKGGKAVASSFGVLLACVPYCAPIAGLLFVITVLIWGYVSISSTSATLAALISAWIIYGILDNQIFTSLILTILAIIIIVRHIPNYKRLINGTENCFKKKNTETH